MTRVRFPLSIAAVFAASVLGAAEPAARAAVNVRPSRELGVVKAMNAVNNGPKVPPVMGDQKRGNFLDYKAARIPFARTHDSINCVDGGAHACDITAIFPCFDADENDPANYDFVFTDYYLDAIRRAGAEVFFRLGQTIEHGPRKYGVLPPKDFAKWARICEHVIRHYNEGWGWGADKSPTTRNLEYPGPFGIKYWEIWNEPDIDAFVDSGPSRNPRCWGGSEREFFEFYETAAKHLKAKFPDLKIGGPALCGSEAWAKRFLAYSRERGSPIDFFSWHIYSRAPETIAEEASRMRKIIDDAGYADAESILNEWNYVKGWRDDWVYSLRVESLDLNLKGAAYTSATMTLCQSRPVDMLMYYDAKHNSSMDGLFARTTLLPLKGYYPFYAWSKLAALGTQVECELSQDGGFYAVAAKGSGGSGALLVTRYSDDDNVSDTGTLSVRVEGVSPAAVRCHLTDFVRTYTEVPPELEEDGSVSIQMQPLSFALFEW